MYTIYNDTIIKIHRLTKNIFQIRTTYILNDESASHTAKGNNLSSYTNKLLHVLFYWSFFVRKVSFFQWCKRHSQCGKPRLLFWLHQRRCFDEFHPAIAWSSSRWTASHLALLATLAGVTLLLADLLLLL